ncbi:MAG: AsmA-like C-terminal domain-containing protein, partial [Deltaproteobacteria bacterium]
VYNYLKGIDRVDLVLDGKMGPQVNRWVSKQIHMPAELTLRSPLSVSKAHVAWDKDSKTAFTGNLVVQNGPKLSIDIVQSPHELRINKLHIQDKDSNASIALGINEKEFGLQFVGNLVESTRERLFVKSELPKGWIQGDFQTQIWFDQPMKSRARGRLIGKNIVFPYEVVAPLRIQSFHLDAEKNVINLESVDCTWGDNPISLNGDVGFSETGLLFDVDLSTDSIDLDNILENLNKNDKNEKNSELFQDIPVQGIVRLKSGKFTYETFTWSPFNANIRLNRDTVNIAITEANLCSVSTPGVVQLSPQHLLLGFEPISKDRELDAALGCLLDRKGLATGKFDLRGKVEAQGKSEEIGDALRGDMAFLAKDGRIFHHRRFTMFEKMFLRVSGNRAFRGRVPDLRTEGFPYDSITIRAKLAAGKLRLKEAGMIGGGMTIACTGDVDLVRRELDLEILVAPFQNVDRIVSRTPLIKRILDGTLVTIPIKVEGNWEDPTVRTLPLSSVKSGLLGILERTVTLPAEVVQPSDASEVAK